MLEEYVKEEYNIVLNESVVPLEHPVKGDSYFAPDSVSFVVSEDGSMDIVLGGNEYFPGDKEVYFSDVSLDIVKKGVIFRVEDLPVLLGKDK